jgi:RNA polymerase sigma-70 factor (ECF subfamily)
MPEREAGRSRDEAYAQAAADHGAALERLARAYEPDADRRRDLLQDIHVALWRSLERFDGRCSLRTWVYRVAHNTATSQVLRRRAGAPALVSLDEVGDAVSGQDSEREVEERRTLERLLELIQGLKPVDRQVMVLYLEGLDAAGIGEITGLSPQNVATKVHRSKQVLVDRFHRKVPHGA